MIEPHRLSPAQLTELSTGVCGPATMRQLRDGQLSKHLLLIRYLAGGVPADARWRPALEILDQARARDPEAASQVLSDPMVGAWLADAVRPAAGAQEPSADADRLACLAAVVAARCGVPADLTIDPGDRGAMFPTVGLLTGLDGGEAVRLRVRGGVLTVTGAAGTVRVPPDPIGRDGHWQGLRRLTSGPAARTLTLDDVSPCRHVYHAPAAGRLSDEEAAQWQLLFADGWRLLERHATDNAVEIVQLLRTVVPLQMDARQISQSATARHAFGALGASRPASAAEMAVTLVHEAYHSLFNAIVQLEPLFDPRDPGRYFAPWRDDPRPVWGLYHGVFAFLAVADLMDRLRAEPGQESAAEKAFAKVREQLRPALEALLGAPSLTDAGRHFAAGMERTLTRLEASAVSRSAADSAARELTTTRDRWQERNGRAG